MTAVKTSPLVKTKSHYGSSQDLQPVFTPFCRLNSSNLSVFNICRTHSALNNFSTFSTSCFYSLEKRFFVLEYRKRYFPGVYCLKKKVGKMAIFGPKPWVNPFGKMSIIRLFQLLVFIAEKGVFSF